MIKRWLLIPWRIIKCAMGIYSPGRMWTWGAQGPRGWLERWEYRLDMHAYAELQAMVFEELSQTAQRETAKRRLNRQRSKGERR